MVLQYLLNNTHPSRCSLHCSNKRPLKVGGLADFGALLLTATLGTVELIIFRNVVDSVKIWEECIN